MNGIARKTGGRFTKFQAAALSLFGAILLLVQTVGRSEEPPKSQPAPKNVGSDKGHPTSAATPVDVYRRYLNAVKKNDLAGAKSCWRITGKNASGALDVAAGIWVSLHRFNAAMGKLDKDARQFVRADCTDAAVDRTLARLDHSELVVTNDTATLTIQWANDDGYPNPAFFFGVSIDFRKTEAGWKIDASEITDDGKDAIGDDSSIESGSHLMVSRQMVDEIVAGVDSGKIKSAADVVRQAEQHLGSLEGLIPFTKTTIYEEDTPTRYLRIKRGTPGVFSRGCVPMPPHRKDSDRLISIEGDLEVLFSEMYGCNHPRIVVETQNKKGYGVAYNPDDPKALEIVAKQLGMIVGEEDREIPALQITVAKSGHHLRKVAKPDTPQWNSSVKDTTPGAAERNYVYPLYGVTLDQLALFLDLNQARFPRFHGQASNAAWGRSTIGQTLDRVAAVISGWLFE